MPSSVKMAFAPSALDSIFLRVQDNSRYGFGMKALGSRVLCLGFRVQGRHLRNAESFPRPTCGV